MIKQYGRITMEKNNNPASRLHRLLEQGAALPGNMATLKAWASLFHLPEPYGVELPTEVSERLLRLNQELEMLEQQLAGLKREDASRENVLKHIRQALSPVYFSTDWENVKQFLSTETLNALASWIEILSQDEKSIQ
jgi:hypothetical protein